MGITVLRRTLVTSIDEAVSERDDIFNPRPHGMLQKMLDRFEEQISHIHPRLIVAGILFTGLPGFAFAEIRAGVLRAIGFDIARKSGFFGKPKIFGRGNIYRRLTIGANTWINFSCNIELNAEVRIGSGVGIGPETMILTGTHEMGSEDNRAGEFIALPVTIEDGVWIGARCTILPGVTIGRGSVIASGSIVNRDVPPNTVILGTQGMPIDKWMKLRKAVG